MQAPTALALGGLAFALMYGVAMLWRYAPIVAAPVLASIITPLLTPLCSLVGIFRYRSRFLLTIPMRGGLALHLGTGFDRIVHRRELGGWSGRAVRLALLVSVLDGLRAIADDVRAGVLPPDTQIAGASHFFGDRTARTFGFEVVPPDLGDRLFFFIGWLDAALWLSVLEGRLVIPSQRQLRRARTTAGALAAHREAIVAMRDRLRRALTAQS